jgi:predicted amidophosphoribosyltransferase
MEPPVGAKFCNECGGRLEMTCPKCGKANPPGSRFCNECGQKFEKEEFVERKEPSIEGERKQVTVLFSDLIG